MSGTNGTTNFDALPEKTRAIAEALTSFAKLSADPKAQLEQRRDAWANEVGSH